VPGANTLTLLAYDLSGSLLASDTIVITSTFDPPDPTITTITPAEGIVGEVVTVEGTGFLPGVVLRFGATASPTVHLVDSGMLTAEVPAIAAGSISVTARNVDGGTSNAVTFTVLSSAVRFIRGDVNIDGLVDISDPLRLLFELFRSDPTTCRDAGDADNNELLNLADALYLLNYLFQGGPAPAAPFPNPGADTGTPGPLGCDQGL